MLVTNVAYCLQEWNHSLRYRHLCARVNRTPVFPECHAKTRPKGQDAEVVLPDLRETDANASVYRDARKNPATQVIYKRVRTDHTHWCSHFTRPLLCVGVLCEDTENGYRCGPCPHGYVGNGIECRLSLCAPQNPCFPGERYAGVNLRWGCAHSEANFKKTCWQVFHVGT